MKKDFLEAKIQRMKGDYPFLVPLNFLDDVRNFIQIHEEERKQIKADFQNSYEKIDGKMYYKKDVKLRLKEINRRIEVAMEYLGYLSKRNYVKPKVDLKKEKTELTVRQYRILQDFIEGKETSLGVEDVQKIYAYVLENEIEHKIELLETIMNYVLTSEDENMLSSKVLLINYFRQKTIYYLNQIYDEKIKEAVRSQLKPRVIDVLKSKKEPSIKKEEYDYLYDILYFWLTDGSIDSYYCLKRIFEIDETAVNIKNSEELFIFTVVDQLLGSCMIELQNQLKDSEYVHKEFYIAVLKLMLENPNLALTKEQQKEIDTQIEDFMRYILKEKYKKANDIIKALKSIRNKEEKQEVQIPQYLYNLKEYNDFLIAKDDRHDMTDEHAVAFYTKDKDHINCAFSFHMNEHGKYVYKIHTVDISSYVLEDTELDRYLKDAMFSSIPKDIALSAMSLSKGVKRPVLTYEITVDLDGKVLTHDIYEGYIEVKELRRWNDLNLLELRNDENLSLMANLFDSLLNDNDIDYDKDNFGYIIKHLLFSTTCRVIGNYFQKRNYPFIYRIQKEQDSQQFCHFMNHLNYLMGKIDKSKAKIVYEVICEDRNYAFYDKENCGHYLKQQPFYIDLFNPMDSYVTLFLQRLIKQYYIRKQEYPDLWQQTSDVIDLANKQKGKQKIIKF